MIDTYSNKDLLTKKLSSFLKKIYLKDILSNQVRITTLLIIFLFLFSIIESFWFLESTIKISGLIIGIILFIIFSILFQYKLVYKYFTTESSKELKTAAYLIGKKFPNIKDNLTNALQLLESNRKNYSDSLIKAAFYKVFKEVSKLNLSKIISYVNLKRNSYVLSLTVITALIVVFIFPFINNGVNRLIDYDKTFIKQADYILSVSPGNFKVKKGSNISLKVNVSGEEIKDLFISTKSITEAEYVKHRIVKESFNKFILKLKNVKESFKYYAHKDNIKSEVYNIEVTLFPIIKNLVLEITPPNYSRIPHYEQIDNGNITALKGSKVNYKFSSTKNLIEAFRVSGENKQQLIVENNKGTGNFIINKNEEYFFRVVDSDSIYNEHPVTYSIELIKDEYPTIEVFKPTQNSLLPTNDIVNIEYTIKDDFGFSKVILKYKISKNNNDELKEFQTIKLLSSENEIDQTNFFNWDVSRLSLKENQMVHYYLEVFDNDNISGPKSTKSMILKLRVPSLDELFTQANKTQESAIQDLKETVKDAEELQNEINKISNELKQNEKEINWNEKERIEESVKKFEKLNEKISEVQEKLSEMKKEMSEQNMLSDETLKKYNELQELMEELSSEEMKKALEKMQKSLEQLMRDKIQKSMENFAENEKLFQKSIERTLNLLKKIQIEQKFDEVIKRTEKISNELEELSDKTEESKKDKDQSDLNQLSEEQEKINEQLKKLDEELEKLQEKMSEADKMPLEEMGELNKKFDDQKNMELSSEAMQQIQKQDTKEALKTQNQLSQNMDSMLNQLKQMQQQMQQKSQQMVMQNMFKAIDDLLSISKEQEKLANDSKQIESNPQKMKDMLNDQMNLNKDLNNILKQVGKLAQKSFAISPEMGEALGNAKKNMKNAIDGLQGKNGRKSSLSQGSAMKNLNQAASLMQSSLQSMMKNGGQGGGMMSLMQQLQQMAQKQMGLNKLTRMLNKGQLTMQQMAQMQRLGKEQGRLQKSLAELNKEARESGESKRIASNLEEILKEMNEVVSGLNTQSLDNELIKKQEKILSKLLDAQRSINERDFEKNRESISGKIFKLNSPESILLDDLTSQDLLKEELLKSFKEGYSKDYESLIRKYFESLKNSEQKN